MSDAIDRQAAIDVLDAYQVMVENGEENPYAWARLRMSELPSAQPEKRTGNARKTHACDCISRQAAIDALDKRFDSIPMNQTTEILLLRKDLRELPSAQPEIIRCRDCKHWDKTWTNDWSPDYHYCPMIDGVRKGNFYCADAERRTDG